MTLEGPLGYHLGMRLGSSVLMLFLDPGDVMTSYLIL